MVTTLNIDFQTLKGTNSIVSGGVGPKFSDAPVQILPKFKLIQAFMVVLNTCKNEEDLIKIEGARVVTTLEINF